MAQTQHEDAGREKREADAGTAGKPIDVRPEETEAPSGMEINLGDFTRTQGLMKSLRLMLEGQVIVPLEDVASGLSDAGRKFKMGEIEQANQDVTRMYAAFGQRTNQWENQARNLEQQMKMQAAKNPKSISIDKMNRMKSEQTAVKTRIRTAEVQFRRLHQGLDQAFTNLQSAAKPEQADSEMAADLPAGFVARLQAASLAERPEIVRQYFDVEAELSVQVSRGAAGGYEIKFDPPPALARLYFLARTGQVIRLQALGNVVVIQNVETGEELEMKLVEFVKQVQGGAWVLKVRGGED